MGRFTNPTPQFLDDNGVPLDGGLLYFYDTGTTTPKATYSDSALTIANANPVVLDSAGRVPNIFASVDDEYRVVLKTSANVTVWTKDNVQFPDATELVALIQALQDQIDNLDAGTGVFLQSITNPSCDGGSQGATALTASYQEGAVPGTFGRVTGTLSAGTLTQGVLAGLGAIETQALMDGVTGDSSSVIEFATRVYSVDAYRYVNKTVSMSCLIRQESGVTAVVTTQILTCDNVNDFSSLTLVSQNVSSAASDTNVTSELAAVAMGDCSNGFQILVKIAPGAAFTTKDFYITDWNLSVAATVQTYAPEAAAYRYLQAYLDSLTGMVSHFEVATPPFGWVRQHGGTIGNVGSGATERAHPDCRRLFIQRWNTFDNTLAPVSGGRGASAEADWQAGKTLGLFDDRGRFSRGLNTSGSGIDPSRALGSAQDDEVREHAHGIGLDTNDRGTGGAGDTVSTNNGILSTTYGGDETRPYNRAYLVCVHL